MTKTQAAHVINATVRLDNLGGHGVLVPGGFILTAAHSIQWSGEGGMATGDRFIESITTKSGARFRVGPCAVEPPSDIAVLGSLDDQVFFDDCEQPVRRFATPKIEVLVTYGDQCTRTESFQLAVSP